MDNMNNEYTKMFYNELIKQPKEVAVQLRLQLYQGTLDENSNIYKHSSEFLIASSAAIDYKDAEEAMQHGEFPIEDAPQVMSYAHDRSQSLTINNSGRIKK